MTDLTYRSPRTEVRDSAIHGRGLFARGDRARRDRRRQGRPRPHAPAVEGAGAQLGSAEIQLTEDLFIAPGTQDERHGSMLYVNHCCDPNVAIQGQIVLVAMRDIRAGEELTIDWATTDDLDEEMRCRCGSPHCRGVISGKDWMKPELQAKYRGWFCWFLQRKIDAAARL